MTIEAQLFDDKFVTVDDRTAHLGGSFYYSPLRAYSPLPLKWCYEQLIRYPTATLLDVGASTGCYTLLAKHHPDLTVYAFEPVPLTYHVLRENIHLNGLQDRVHVYPFGVADYSGKGIMNVVIANGGKGVSMLGGKVAWHKVTEPVEVEVVTIDAFCEKNDIVPSFLKLDTEGSELFVLQGARETIEKYHPFILVEISAENSDQFGYAPSSIIALLEEFGYVWTSPEGTDAFCVPIGWENIGKIQNIVGED
jgi:FkbM family methyltransferase